MASSETKIELATEAIEALVLAVIVATAPASNPDEQRANHRNVVDAREIVKAALKELLAPALRVITNPTPPVAEVVPFGGKGIDGMNLA